MLNKFFDKFIFTNGLRFVKDNFFLLKIPFVICPNDLFVGFVARNDPELNKEIYYSTKLSMREYFSKRINEEFELKGDKYLEFIQAFFSASGWGKIELIDFERENNRAIISVENSPVANELNGKVSFEVDHFIRGVLAAAFSEAYEINFDAVEIKCKARGEERCEFIVKKSKDFSELKEQSMKQLRFNNE